MLLVNTHVTFWMKEENWEPSSPSTQILLYVNQLFSCGISSHCLLSWLYCAYFCVWTYNEMLKPFSHWAPLCDTITVLFPMTTQTEAPLHTGGCDAYWTRFYRIFLKLSCLCLDVLYTSTRPNVIIDQVKLPRISSFPFKVIVCWYSSRVIKNFLSC